MNASITMYGSTAQYPTTEIQNERQLWQLNGFQSGRLNVISALATPMEHSVIVKIIKIMFELFYCLVNILKRYICFVSYVSIGHAIHVHLCDLFTKHVTVIDWSCLQELNEHILIFAEVIIINLAGE